MAGDNRAITSQSASGRGKFAEIQEKNWVKGGVYSSWRSLKVLKHHLEIFACCLSNKSVADAFSLLLARKNNLFSLRWGGIFMNINLIRELNSDHALILEALVKIKEAGNLSDETRNLLRNTKELLINHLQKEESEFYPILRKEAETNDSLKQTMKVMGIEIEEIGKQALAFLDTYIGGGTETVFKQDLDRFITTITMRLQREEHTLYSKYLKISEKNRS